MKVLGSKLMVDFTEGGLNHPLAELTGSLTGDSGQGLSAFHKLNEVDDDLTHSEYLTGLSTDALSDVEWTGCLGAGTNVAELHHK